MIWSHEKRACGLSFALALLVHASSSVSAQPQPNQAGLNEPSRPVSAPAGSSVINSAPTIRRLLPRNQDAFVTRPGETLSFHFELVDLDGDKLQLSGHALPQGSVLDDEAWSFSWTPKPGDVGEHVLKFTVSDGRAESARLVVVNVTQDARIRLLTTRATLEAGKPSVIPLKFEAPRGLPVKVQSALLPSGAELRDEGSIYWTPTAAQRGSHTLQLTVSDGVHAETLTAVWEVSAASVTADEWQSFMLPGLGYAAYLPANDGALAQHGVYVELVLAAWIHRNDNRGPSHGRSYLKLEILNTADEDEKSFGYAAGISLSLERNPRRRWLIPYYAVELGGLNPPKGPQLLRIVPMLGVHFWSTANFFVNAQGGYAIVPSSMDERATYHLGFSANVTLW